MIEKDKDIKKRLAVWIMQLEAQNKELITENQRLRRLLESRKSGRYARVFGLFRRIAETRKFGTDYLGLLMAKDKTMRAFKIKSLKALSDVDLKAFEDYLSSLASDPNKKIKTEPEDGPPS